MEHQPGHAGAVPLDQLLAGPGGMDVVAVKDAVVDDQFIDLGDAIGRDRIGPEGDERFDVQGSAVGIDHPVQQRRVAEGGVAVADDHQPPAIQQQACLVGEVGSKQACRRAAGQELHVAGGNAGGLGIDVHQAAAGFGVDDADTDILAFQAGSEDGLFGIPLQGRLAGGDAGQQCKRGRQGVDKSSGMHRPSVASMDSVVIGYRPRAGVASKDGVFPCRRVPCRLDAQYQAK